MAPLQNHVPYFLYFFNQESLVSLQYDFVADIDKKQWETKIMKHTSMHLLQHFVKGPGLNIQSKGFI